MFPERAQKTACSSSSSTTPAAPKKSLYIEPEDACEGKGWRMYIFKDDALVGERALEGKSCFWLGRDANENDVHLAHESCSKRHAVLQFRGDGGGELYLLDLSSTHGTFIVATEGGEGMVKLEPMRFYHVRSRERVRFAASTREYLFLDEGFEMNEP